MAESRLRTTERQRVNRYQKTSSVWRAASEDDRSYSRRLPVCASNLERNEVRKR